MTTVAIKKPGRSWERHLVSRDKLKWFLCYLTRQGVTFRLASP
jgi:hypothetical protein